jgi:protein-S-isoprenylcysteine O-methyltransferase Ste14
MWADCAFFLGLWTLVAFRAHFGLRAWIGMALASVGFALWLTARLQLGNAFSLGARARTLVTTGLYARFRHPIYLFGFVAYAGVTLIWGKWIPFFALVLIYLVEVIRIRKEERVLEQAFGERYRQYKARTWL